MSCVDHSANGIIAYSNKETDPSRLKVLFFHRLSYNNVLLEDLNSFLHLKEKHMVSEQKQSSMHIETVVCYDIMTVK